MNKLVLHLPSINFLLLCFAIFLLIVSIVQNKYYKEIERKDVVNVRCLTFEDEVEIVRQHPQMN